VNIITRPTRRDVALEDGVADHEVPLTDPRVEAVVITGSQIGALEQADWDVILSKKEVVFARTSPQQKLKLVENYQRRGEVVAVTGDGVNDSPALKRAHIGVAMGSEGASDVAREAADIILLDDNFASIVHAIEEGRTLFNNLRKTIAYTLAHLWPELLPVFLNIALTMPLGLPGLIILTIDLFTEQIPAISFSYEVAEGSVMERPPRNPKSDRLVNRSLLIYAYCVAGAAEALTAMFAYLMVYQMAGIQASCLLNTASTFWANPPSIGGSATFFNSGATYVGPQCGPPLSPDGQVALYQQSVSAWYLTIVLCQAGHVWVCKTRLNSIFDHPMFRNYMTAVGVVVAVLIAAFCIYTPGVQTFFYTGPLAGQIWPCALVFWAFILAYTEIVKYCTRKHPTCFAAKYLAW